MVRTQAGLILNNMIKECWDNDNGTDKQRRLKAGGCNELVSGVNEGRIYDEKGTSACRVR